MAQNFLTCDREQELLLPPSLREWLATDHLAWFVLDVVEELDLTAFRAEYRHDGWGRAAFAPAMMVALMLYAYAILERAAAADAADDQRFGESRGDELPAEPADRSSRRARLRAAKKRLEAEVRQAQDSHEAHLQARAAIETQRGRKLRGRKPVAPPA